MLPEGFFRPFRRTKDRNVETGRDEATGSRPAHDVLDSSSVGLKVLQEGANPVVESVIPPQIKTEILKLLSIVAIHGLNGHREKTWTASNGVLWLRDLLPQRLPNSRIITWGYDASTHGRNPISTQYLHDHADALISDLCLERALTSTRRRPIIFVAHSLGGVVLKSALIHSAAARAGAQEEHRSISLSTYGIIFAGTPHQGGEAVTWGLCLVHIASIFVNTNDAMLQHLQRDSEELQRLLRDYAPISNDFSTKFAYETLPTRLLTGSSIMVVPKASAVVPGAADAEPIAIYKDHSNMVKFASADEDGYKKLSGHMFLMVENAGTQISTRWAACSRLEGSSQPLQNTLPHQSISLPQGDSNYEERPGDLQSNGDESRPEGQRGSSEDLSEDRGLRRPAGPNARTGRFPLETQIGLFNEYKCQAKADLQSGFFGTAEDNFLNAMELSEREEVYGPQSDERFEIRMGLAELYIKQGKLEKAEQELQALGAHAKHNPNPELHYSLAALHRMRYRSVRDEALLDDFEDMATLAYSSALDLRSSPNLLLQKAVEIMIEMYQYKSDPVAAEMFRDRHLTQELALGNILTPRPISIAPPEMDVPDPGLPSSNAAQSHTVFTGRSHSSSNSTVSPIAPPEESSTRARASENLLPAVEAANAPLVKFLLSICADTEKTDSAGFTPILIAAKNKQTEIMLLLLEKADVHARDRSGKTVLHHALFGVGGEDMIQAIVDNGADVNAVDNTGRRPLHYCALFNKKTAAEILIKKHADLGARDEAGNTAAMLAVLHKNYQTIELLYKNGATFDKDAIPEDLNSVKRILNLLDQANTAVSRRNSAPVKPGVIPWR